MFRKPAYIDIQRTGRLGRQVQANSTSFAERMSISWKQPVVIENRGSAGGSLRSNVVVKAGGAKVD